MNLQVKTSPSFGDLASQFRGFENILIGKLRDALYGYGLLIEREAKLETPVDTGRLRSSIGTSMMIRSQGMEVLIQPNVKYAEWIHEGKMVRNGNMVYLKGHGRAGTPKGGKKYMLLGVEHAEKDGNVLISNKINEALKVLKESK